LYLISYIKNLSPIHSRQNPMHRKQFFHCHTFSIIQAFSIDDMMITVSISLLFYQNIYEG